MLEHIECGDDIIRSPGPHHTRIELPDDVPAAPVDDLPAPRIFDDVESGQSVRRAAELSQAVAVGCAYVQEGPAPGDVGPHHRQDEARPGLRTPVVGRAVQHGTAEW